MAFEMPEWEAIKDAETRRWLHYNATKRVHDALFDEEKGVVKEVEENTRAIESIQTCWRSILSLLRWGIPLAIAAAGAGAAIITAFA